MGMTGTILKESSQNNSNDKTGSLQRASLAKQHLQSGGNCELAGNNTADSQMGREESDTGLEMNLGSSIPLQRVYYKALEPLCPKWTSFSARS